MARQNWLDSSGASTVIDDYANQLASFIEAIADGKVEDKEVSQQEQRVVALMKEVEPKLDDAMHEKVTRLLCELSAFNIMQLLNSLQQARPKSKFVG